MEWIPDMAYNALRPKDLKRFEYNVYCMITYEDTLSKIISVTLYRYDEVIDVINYTPPKNIKSVFTEVSRLILLNEL